MSAEAAFATCSWKVGCRTVTLTFPRPKPGQPVFLTCEWAPNDPNRMEHRMKLVNIRPIAKTLGAAEPVDRSRTSHLYSHRRWRRIRARHLALEQLCRFCLAEGRVTPATVVDHVTPHRGDMDRFWNGERQSLCATHHSRDKQRAEARGGGKKPFRTGSG